MDMARRFSNAAVAFALTTAGDFAAAAADNVPVTVDILFAPRATSTSPASLRATASASSASSARRLRSISRPTLPDSGKRFMSMQIINEDEHTPAVYYGAGSHTLRECRHSLRRGGDPHPRGPFGGSQTGAGVAGRNQGRAAWRSGQVRGAGLGSGQPEDGARRPPRARLDPSDFKGAFGAKGEVDPVRHLIGAAAAWGGNPPRTPSISTSRRQKNDGKTIYKLDVKDVPVDGFWSVTVYNAKGYLEPNPYSAYSLNNLTAKTGDDGYRGFYLGCQSPRD